MGPIALSSALLLIVMACAGNSDGATGSTDPSSQGPETSNEVSPDQDEEQSPTTSSQVTEQEGSQSLPFESGDGSFVVDGEQFEAVWVVRCEIVLIGQDPHDENLDLLAYGGESVYLDLEISAGDEYAVTAEGRRGEFIYTATYFDLRLVTDAALTQFEDRVVNGPGGNWYANAVPHLMVAGKEFPSVPEPVGFTIEDDRIRGTLTLEQSWPEDQDATVDVTFDLSIPSEEFDCSTL